MASKRTHARHGGGGPPDRLSALPDCLLHSIMSFLKARQAVQTCVLSRRWRHLWRSVPCLDIDFDEFIRADVAAAPDFDDSNNAGSGGGNGIGILIPDHGNDGSSDSDDSSESEDSSDPEDYDNSESDIDSSSSSSSSSSASGRRRRRPNHMDKGKKREWEGFEDFTVNLLHHCNIAQLDSFRLHISRGTTPRFGDSHVEGWLRRAMKHCIPDPAPRRNGLMSSGWLLKRLHLCYVPLDDRFKEHVRSVCHSLEDLELKDCKCDIQSITSHSLKTLVLKRCRWNNLEEITSPKLKTLVIVSGSNVSFRPVVILAPAVAYLHLAVNVRRFCGGISMNEMPSLA
ncbi:unnamed protein product [Urochloa decumbens]|uniref:F-box domain-containing protein n=1 Tax=Urochloa decumbens TaxID=240449 RepID=A0ABC9B580_9POAL